MRQLSIRSSEYGAISRCFTYQAGSVTLMTAAHPGQMRVWERISGAVYRRSDPGQLSPGLETRSLKLPMLKSREEMTPEMEVIADSAEHGEEPLGRG